MRRDRLYLEDMLEACIDVSEFVIETDYDAFIIDKLKTSAVLQKLMIIGEAAARISEEIKMLYPDIEWAVIAGMRNRLVHGYFAVDWPLVWIAVQDEIPALKNRLHKIIEEDILL